MNQYESAVLVAASMLLSAFLGQLFPFISTLRSEKNKQNTDMNKPKMDAANARLAEASAAETMGKAWDQLFKKTQEEIDELKQEGKERDDTIRRQGETISALMKSQDRLSTENMTLKTEKDQLAQRVGEYEDENKQLKIRVSEQAIEIQNLRTELNALKEKQANV